MKKILLSLLALANCAISFAKQVDEHTAKTVGYNFLKTQTHTGVPADANGLQLAYTVKSANQTDVCMYLFNTGANGFVIVSGDDIANPVLGYSDEGVVDVNNMPRDFTYLTNGFKSDISYGIEHNIAATSAIKSKWSALQSTSPVAAKATSVPGVAPLITTKWNQSPYYNYTCPFDNAQNAYAVTGCVATAMAQVMKFWNYPSTGTGSHSYHHQQYGNLSANFGATTYRWSIMGNVINGTSVGAIDTVMFHAGVSVNMGYGVDESGAFVISSASPTTYTAEYALKSYFGYKPSLQGLERNNYSTDQWMAMLKMELNASRPIIYAGFGTQGGHCWVADGYDANSFLHLNWGWGGYCNGYFSVDAMDPAAMGPGNGFNSDQQAIVGIMPANPGIKMELNDMLSLPTTIAYNQPFSISTKIINNGTNTFGGDYIARVFNENGQIIDSIQLMAGNTLNAGDQTNTLTFSTSGSSAMTPGNYTVGVFYRPTGKTWFEVNGNGNYANLINVNVTAATAVSELANNAGIRIFPNPATDVINIYATGTGNSITKVKITDLQGRTVTTLDTKNNSSIAIPVSTLAGGMYFVQTQTTSGSQTDKVVIKK